MTTCPLCNLPLVKRISRAGVLFVCPYCGGKMVGFPVLRQAGAQPAFLRDLWLAAKCEGMPHKRPCAHCGSRMAEVSLPAADHTLTLDICPACNAAWFDAKEVAQLPRDPDHAHQEMLSEDAKEAAGRLALEADRRNRTADGDFQSEAPDSAWQWIPAALGLPVETDAPPLRSRPILTWALAAILVIVFADTFASLRTVIDAWGFIPSQWYRHGGLTLATSFFLHAGIWHLVANVYFLLIFADNVEDSLGPLLFIALLAGADLAGNLAHAAGDPQSMLPCVGASGGISGVLGYYAVVFPNAQIGVMLRWWMAFQWLRVPAWFAALVFVAIQCLGAMMQVHGGGGVSFLAHLGGLAVGLGAGIAHRALRRLPPDFA